MNRTITQKLRGYLSFNSMPYRIFLFAVLPVICCLIMIIPFFTGIYLLAACISLGTLLSLEMLGDFWIFGGISSKDGGLPEFLKTSPIGPAFMRNALNLNTIRLLAAHLLVFLMGRLLFCVVTGQPYIQISDLLLGSSLTLASFFFTELGLFLARFFSSLNIQMILALIMILLFTLSGIVSAMHPVAVLTITLAASLLLVVLADRIFIHKIKEAYYDK